MTLLLSWWQEVLDQEMQTNSKSSSKDKLILYLNRKQKADKAASQRVTKTKQSKNNAETVS